MADQAQISATQKVTEHQFLVDLPKKVVPLCQDLPTPLSEVAYLQHYQNVLIKISPIKVVHQLLNLQNQKEMPLYKEFISDKFSRARTQFISKFYVENRYVIFK